MSSRAGKEILRSKRMMYAAPGDFALVRGSNTMVFNSTAPQYLQTGAATLDGSGKIGIQPLPANPTLLQFVRGGAYRFDLDIAIDNVVSHATIAANTKITVNMIVFASDGATVVQTIPFFVPWPTLLGAGGFAEDCNWHGTLLTGINPEQAIALTVTLGAALSSDATANTITSQLTVTCITNGQAE
jgi:hypothetical protein